MKNEALPRLNNARCITAVFLITLTLAACLQATGSAVGSRLENGAVPDPAAMGTRLSSVLPGGGCFGGSTRIPGVEGAFAVVATDDVGGVYVAYQSHWLDNSDPYMHVFFAYSHDYGGSWSDSFQVDDGGSGLVQCDSPGIAVDPLTGHVFVAWKDNRTGAARVYVDTSVDRGLSFGPDVLVHDGPDDHVPMGLPYTVSIQVGGEGSVYVAWVAYYGASYTDGDLFFARSTDDGQTFSSPVIVTPDEGEARLAHPGIAIDEASILYVAYAHRNATFSAVYLARSLTDGQSFELPVKVNDDATVRYRGGAQVAVSSDGNVHVTWTDGRAGEGTQYLDIYYAVSLDGGVSFQPNIRVNDDEERVASSQHFTRGAHGTPAIATDSGSRVHLVWEDFRNFVSETTSCRDLYYASSGESQTFTKSLRANSVNAGANSTNCADPNMAIDSQDSLFIVYSDAPSGDNDHHEIYFLFAPASAWAWITPLDWAHYHTYAEITTILAGLNATYPSIVDVFSIGQSWRSRDIYCVRLTNESNAQPKPEVLFVGYHHAQEQISAELPLYCVVDAATNYGLDTNLTTLLSTRAVYVIVALNVDGLDLLALNDRHRKNARPLDDDADSSADEDPPEDLNGNGLIEVLMNYTDPYNPVFLGYEGTDNDTDGANGEDWIGGVDLNRNYPVGWENADPDPASPVYRGPAPLSEPETTAMSNLVLTHNFTHALSFHSGLEFIIYPWGYTADPTLDDAKFQDIAQHLSNITGGTPYASPTVMYGIWDDWLYNASGVLAVTCEIFRNGTWMDAPIEPGPAPNTTWIGGERWLYNPFPSSIDAAIHRWLPVFTYIIDLARPPNLAIAAVTPSKTMAGQGYVVNVTVVVVNQGSLTEAINVTLLLNDSALASQSLLAESGRAANCTFVWNTTGFAKGNYTIQVVVSTVPRETNTTDNTLAGHAVFVTIPGDVNGNQRVDIFDIVLMASGYGTEPPDPRYDPNCDINGDDDVDIFDIVLAARNYGFNWQSAFLFQRA